MTKEELMNTPQFLDNIDIMNIFKCARNKALGIMRMIKSFSDIAGIKGKVTITDYEAWYNRNNDRNIADKRLSRFNP